MVTVKKIILILLLFPFFGWSQKTNFTDEQIEFGDKFYEKMKNTNLTEEEFIPEVQDALTKVPYFPPFVHSLLIAKFNLRDFRFINDYCSRLDDNYLSTFQPILDEVCACGYFFNRDNHGLIHRIIPLIKDKDTKELFLTAYYLGIEDYKEFIKLGKSSLSKSYDERLHMILASQLLGDFIAILHQNENAKELAAFSRDLKEYEATIFSSDLSIPIYYILIQSTIFNYDFVMAEKLIDYVKKQDVDNYKYLHPISALFYSHRGEERLTFEALEQAFDLEDSAFERITMAENVSLDIFSSYSMSIRKIEDYKTKERLVNQAITYFEKREEYKIRFKLYQSLLYASKDIDKGRAILKECEPYLIDQNLKDIDYMLRIENELAKENPNYRMVDDFMQELTPYKNIPEVIFQRIVYQFKVNYNSKKPVFSLKEMVEELDKLLKYPLIKEAKLKYLRFKIIIIGQKDREWAKRELEKLPEDEAEEIIGDFESTANNSQKATDILISNTNEFKDFKENSNLIHVGYINAIRIKK
ncbi:hypothetical protein [Flavobacterium orientale]|uniref:Tetratricopeptide repeat-containing protein n=1 Tax=Flavobacterium orientale TaxID=1756020 RepID=A0A916Y9M0_9FLAO|nr:hypothetical protein [Flavobacterium orientale]GGD35114.1 hypothetical protein GCM10011343_26230 [Flavobacterium orientale]